MNTKDIEEHRLVALAAGYDFYCDNKGFYWKCGDHMPIPWDPKKSKADAFDLHTAIYVILVEERVKYNFVINNLHEALISDNNSKSVIEAIFKCAVEIGRDKEIKQRGLI